MSIIWGGRSHQPDVGLGNKLFLFFSAAIYSQQHNLNIISDGKGPEKKIRSIVKLINIDKLYYKKEKAKGTHKLQRLYKDNNLIYQGDNMNYIFCEYYHNSTNIAKNYDLIKPFIDLDFHRVEAIENIKKKYTITNNDVLCYIRLGDFNKASIIVSPEYYLNILNENNYNKIFLVIFNNWNDYQTEKYLQYFEKYKDKLVVIINGDIKEDFYMPYLFQNIVVSNSTFCWWSVFLNSDETKNIYLTESGFYGKTYMFETSKQIKEKYIKL